MENGCPSHIEFSAMKICSSTICPCPSKRFESEFNTIRYLNIGWIQQIDQNEDQPTFPDRDIQLDSYSNSNDHGNWIKTSDHFDHVGTRSLSRLQRVEWSSKTISMRSSCLPKAENDSPYWTRITIGRSLPVHSSLCPRHSSIYISKLDHRPNRTIDGHICNSNYFLHEENLTIQDDRIHCLTIRDESGTFQSLLKLVLPSKLSQPSPPKLWVNKRIILCKARPRSMTGVRSAKTDMWV